MTIGPYKMPKLESKFKKRHIEFSKIQLLHGDNAKLCRGQVNHDPKAVVGVVDDLKKKNSALVKHFLPAK